MRDGKGPKSNRKVAIREGYQGGPLPPGVTVAPPKGPAADIPAKKVDIKK